VDAGPEDDQNKVLKESKMNEKQAIQAGYSFSGAYSYDKEEMKDRAKEERCKGNKAIVVNCPPDRLSRGHRGMGYCVYFIKSDANKKAEVAEAKANHLRNLQSQLDKARAEVERLEKEIAGL
jgi:hypothetical protein